MKTTLFTGLPRSGTSMICAVLGEQDNTVALAEPLAPKSNNPDISIQEITSFIASARETALTSGRALTKNFKGRAVDNFCPPPTTDANLRTSIVTTDLVALNKPLNDSFHLLIKQPAWFMGLALELNQAFDFFCVLRNPLAVLASWQTVDMPIQKGYFPNATRFDHKLTETLNNTEDRLARQLCIIKWAYQKFAQFPDNKLIKYEDFIEDPTKAMQGLGFGSLETSFTLRKDSIEERYQNVDLPSLQEALETIRPAFDMHYPCALI